MAQKRVYTFGAGKAEGDASMRETLGGKGANLAEMNLIGVPVPPGFTITTDCCNEYYVVGEEKIKELLQDEVMAAVAHTEELMNSKFGSVENPLLVSVRSGARASMPGMMDTILNLFDNSFKWVDVFLVNWLEAHNNITIHLNETAI